MPFNGSGVFQRVRSWMSDAAAGIKIRADFHDVEDDGFAAGLSNCITRDGQSTITQNIPFNNKRITGLADPVNAQDAATKAYTDASAAASLPDTGGTMTGDLIIEKDDAALKLDTNEGFSSLILGQKDGETRWALVLGDETAEAGSNAGSNFALERYDDAGVIIDSVLTIDRASGLLVVKGPPTADGGVVNKAYADGAYQAKDPQLFAGIPINNKSANHTLELTDAQKAVVMKAAGTVTIPTDATANFPIGTCVTVISWHGGVTTLAAASGVNAYFNLGGAVSAFPKSLSNVGIITMIKVDPNVWFCGGSGVT